MAPGSQVRLGVPGRCPEVRYDDVSASDERFDESGAGADGDTVEDVVRPVGAELCDNGDLMTAGGHVGEAFVGG